MSSDIRTFYNICFVISVNSDETFNLHIREKHGTDSYKGSQVSLYDSYNDTWLPL